MELLRPDRPRSSPPDLYAGILDDSASSGHLNPSFSHDEPTFVSNGGFDYSNSVNSNHLIFDTSRTKRYATLNGGPAALSGNHTLRPRSFNLDGLRNNNYIYATTRLPQSSRIPKWLEGVSPDTMLRPSKTVGRQSGQNLYIRAKDQRLYSPRRHVSNNSGVVSSVGSGGLALVDGTGTIIQHSKMERKDNCFAFFDIEMDKVGSYQYRPGEEVTGAIKIIVRKPVEIRYVELVVIGHGHVTLRKSRETVPPQHVTETYLSKQKFIIGSGDGGWSSVLTPGEYTSKFRVKLPSDLPSTIHYNDAKHGLSIDIDYTLRARICDDVPHRLTHHPGQHSRVRVLLDKKVSFNVQRAFDISQISDAMAPVSHCEQIYLSCVHSNPALVTLTLDRAVCLAGDDVRLTLSALLPSSHRVKDITCELHEHIRFEPKHTPMTLTLSHMVIKKDAIHKTNTPATQHSEQKRSKHNNSNSTHQQQHHQQQQQHRKANEESIYEMTLPTNTGLISPYTLMGSGSKLKISYSVNVTLRISPAGGKLSFKMPLDIGPCAEPIYAEKISSRKAVPLFNRPTRFPYFSSPTPPTPNTLSRPSSAQSSRSALITTEYTNSCLASCFLCCLTATD